MTSPVSSGPSSRSLTAPSRTNVAISNPACGCAPPTGRPGARSSRSSISAMNGSLRSKSAGFTTITAVCPAPTNPGAGGGVVTTRAIPRSATVASVVITWFDMCSPRCDGRAPGTSPRDEQRKRAEPDVEGKRLGLAARDVEHRGKEHDRRQSGGRERRESRFDARERRKQQPERSGQLRRADEAYEGNRQVRRPGDGLHERVHRRCHFHEAAHPEHDGENHLRSPERDGQRERLALWRRGCSGSAHHRSPPGYYAIYGYC